MRGDEAPEAATANLTRLVAHRAALRDGSRVCDVGCGYRGPARYFAARHGAEVVGLTLSRRQARHARERDPAGEAGKSARYLLADWLRSPFADGGFDAVVAIESASHMADKKHFLREARRVLAPGGRLVVAAWLAGEDAGPWARRNLLEPICIEGRLPGLASESEYRTWMADEQLRLLSFDDLSRKVRKTWSVCVRRVAGRLLTDPAARRYVLDRGNRERVFALGVARIWLAYRTGHLRYGVFTAVA